MSKIKIPITSKDAYEAKQQTIQSDWQRIVKALAVIVVGNYQAIAKEAGMDDVAVNRRLSEMRKGTSPLVVRLDSTSATSSGNKAHDYKLSERQTFHVEHPANQLITKTQEAQAFLNELQSGVLDPKPIAVVQQNLFP